MDWFLRWITTAKILLLYWTWAECALSGYNETPTQYHIQTDEGPERFFRFQTFNGQFRKERRLDDGTVVGSYGWVDPAGFLRMTDFIADGKGYRVLKSRMEYVGVKAMPEVETKKYTPMKHSKRVAVPEGKTPVFLNALESITVPQISNAIPTPRPALKLNDAPTTFSPRLYAAAKPLPKLYPSRSTYTSTQATSTKKPESVYSYPTTTTTSTTTTTTTTTTENPQTAAGRRRNFYTRSAISQLNDNPPSQPNIPQRGGFIALTRKASTPNIFRVAVESRPEAVAVFPVSRFGRPRTAVIPAAVVQNESGSDGTVDVFRNYTTPLRRGQGFVYKIPHQYHKDETEEDGSRTGSFGYVDPFGIRRVIHYNAGPRGFAHTKDFQYVGKQAE